MTITAELMLSVIMGAATGVGAWVAVRADLARAIVKAENAEKAAATAHARIDSLLQART